MSEQSKLSAADMLDQERLKELLSFDAETGIFTWRVTRNGAAKPGKQAGTMRRDGYLQIRINNKTYAAHRLAWLYVYGVWPSDMVDHINRDKTDNRISNLRAANGFENQYNATIRRDNTSGVKCVTWHKSMCKWQVKCRHMGVRHHGGYYDNLSDAESAAISMRKRLHNEYARNS